MIWNGKRTWRRSVCVLVEVEGCGLGCGSNLCPLGEGNGCSFDCEGNETYWESERQICREREREVTHKQENLGKMPAASKQYLDLYGDPP